MLSEDFNYFIVRFEVLLGGTDDAMVEAELRHDGLLSRFKFRDLDVELGEQRKCKGKSFILGVADPLFERYFVLHNQFDHEREAGFHLLKLPQKCLLLHLDAFDLLESDHSHLELRKWRHDDAQLGGLAAEVHVRAFNLSPEAHA